MHSIPEVDVVLSKLMHGARTILKDDYVGGYIVGSIATGDFDAYSDLDFQIVIRQELTTSQVDALQILHADLRGMNNIWAEKLEGSYFPLTKLESHDVTGTNLWYLENWHRTLAPSKHDDTLVVRWVFRERGIAFDGPEPRSLTPPIPLDALKAEVISRLPAILKSLADEPTDGLYFWNRRFGQSYAVLTCCRIMYTLETGRVESKKKAVEWSRTGIDPRWSGLIERAWASRCGDFESPADPVEYTSTLEFYAWAITEATKVAEGE